jgi:chemotaxis response regulator CheB
LPPIRVFIIDDSQVIRTIIGRVLSASPDCELVGSSPSAERAHAAIAALQPDVITLDIALPGEDGLNYLKAPRSATRPAIVVVSASTTAGSPATEEALASGADACFDKARIVSDADLFVRTLTVAARAA